MSTLTCFDADPDLRTMVQRIADCARHQGGHQTSDYLARKLARRHDDAVGARSPSGRPQILDMDLETHPLETEGSTPTHRRDTGGRSLLPIGWRLLWAPAWWALWRAMAWDELSGERKHGKVRPAP